MARRRRWGTGARLAHGLGQGASDAMALLMRDALSERQADRTAQRQLEHDERIAERMTSAAEAQRTAESRNTFLNDLPELSETMTPDAIEALMQARGVQLPGGRSVIDAARPPMRRKLESSVGKFISGADSPEQLGESDILGQILGADPRTRPADDEPGMRVGGLHPEAYEYVARAQDKAQALRDKPTNVVAGTDPVTGQGFSRMVSPTQHAQGIATSPTPTQQGTFAGQQKVSEINASGAALAAQEGREASARRHAELTAEMSRMGLTQQQQSAALQLSDDFRTESREYLTLADKFRNISVLSQRIRQARASGGDSPASHIGLVFNFMKMQDADSAVLPGEQATAQNASGADARVRNLYNRLLLGGRLPPEQVDDFLRTSAEIYKSTLVSHKERIRVYGQRAAQYGVPATLVVREPDAALETATSSALDKLRGRQ